eukprot:jgi/Mesvir1/10357/Mv10558-RA.1
MNSAVSVARGATEENVRNSARARVAKPAAGGWSGTLFIAIAAVAVIALVIWKPWNSKPGDGGGDCVTGMVCGSETAPFGGGGAAHGAQAFRMGQVSGVTSGMLTGDYDSTFSALLNAS